MAGSRCASGCRTNGAAVMVETPVAIESVWRWAAREYAGSWRIMEPIVAVPWVQCLEHGLGLIP